jgi:hypothetical protein
MMEAILSSDTSVLTGVSLQFSLWKSRLVGCYIYIYIYGTAVEPSPLLLRPFIGPFYQPWIIDDDDCGPISAMNQWQGNRRALMKPALSTTRPT